MPIIGGDTGIALYKADFSMLKGFEKDDLSEVVPAFEKSCAAIKKSPRVLQRGKIVFDTTSYQRICRRFDEKRPQTTPQFRQFVLENFEPYKVVQDLNATGKFTSYYEAELNASLNKHGKYIYPVYGRPQDLIEIKLKDFDQTLPDRRLLMRIENQKAKPYYTRAEIDRMNLNAPVVLWGDDPVDIFLMQIQGSAVANLDDGTQVRIRYSDNNGHPFIGIGRVLLQSGVLKEGEASMDKIRDWLKENPKLASENMAKNPRYVFHQRSDADGPIGALGVTLTAGRSLAVDPEFIPLGSLLWLETTTPDKEPLQKMVAAQDIGGAIKGAVRGDYFWGHGEEALLSAGKMNQAGQYYILLPRNSGVKIRD